MIRAGVVGAAGFAGVQLVHILRSHPDMELVSIASDSLAGLPLSEVYPAFNAVADITFCRSEDLIEEELDVVFLAVPHTASLQLTPQVVQSRAVAIDLSADFRLRDPKVYEAWYGTPHTQVDLLAQAVFGLPELYPEELAAAADAHERHEPVIVACAGCYPTATSLAAAPAIRAGFLRRDGLVVADAISGVTGAGKKPSARTHFCFANENVEAYGVSMHRHIPEIEQILQIPDRLVFTPHLAPLNRGLLSTVTIPLEDRAQAESPEAIWEMYCTFYEGCSFVSVLPLGEQPRTAAVAGSNRAQVAVAMDVRTGALIATGAIDNLCKGAAGQAVQCANIVFGLPESAGLESVALPV